MSELSQNASLELPLIEKKVKERAAYPVSCVDQVFAGSMFFLAFLAIENFGLFMNPAYYGAGVAVYTLLYGTACLTYARLSGKKLGKEAVFWFAVMGISAISYVFVYHQTLMQFHALFLRLVTLYFTAVVFGALVLGRTSNFFLWDGMNLLVLIPLANWKAQWRVFGDSKKYGGWLRAVCRMFLGLVVAIPLFILVIRLLSGADENFTRMLWRLTEAFEKQIRDGYGWGTNLVLAVPLGAYLFALCYGGAHKRGMDTVKPAEIRKFGKECRVVPEMSICAVLVGICLLYVLFIGLQGSYYLDAVRGVLPEGFTYSAYARKGFFELVKVSILNVIVILAATLLSCKGRTRLLRLGTVIISVLTLFLIGTAMTKMFLYIRAYGLTPLRVIPSLFMVFLAVVFLLVIAAQFRRIRVVPIAVCVFALGYSLLSVSNMDGWIAAYNLSRYEAGTLESFPEEVLVEGSLASIPAMYQTWATTPSWQTKQWLEAAANDIIAWSCYLGDGFPAESLREANVTRYRALNCLDSMGVKSPE